MSKDEQKSKRRWIVGIVIAVIAIVPTSIGVYYQYLDNKNQMGGSMNVMWQNHPLNNNETKTIVICLENGAISSDSLTMTPTFENTGDHSLEDFSLSFVVNCNSVTLTPAAVFTVTEYGENKLFTYDKDFLSAHDKAPTPFSCIKLNSSKGRCFIKSKATYNGIPSAFQSFIDVWFFVVPNKNNLSYDQWRSTCERFVIDQMKDVSCDIYCFANEKVIVRNESEPNYDFFDNNIDNTNDNNVDNTNNNNAGNTNDNNIGNTNNKQKVYDGFSHAFNSDSTSIIFTSKPSGISFVMKLVEGGTFLMGAQFEDSSKPNFSSYDERLKIEHGFNNETPVHQASLNSFYLGETEVTQELWRYVTGNEPTYGKRDYGRGYDYPVYYVSWEDCQSFIKRLNSMTGLCFRLPTEEEWEFAARGGKKGSGNKYAGGNNMDDVGWYCRNSGEAYLKGDLFNMGDLIELRRSNKNKTHPVKTKCPNELGLYDMSGNVWEMCSNKYYSYSYGIIQTNNTGNEYVQRGGSWGSAEDFCRVSCRGTANTARNATGFRLALPK